MSRIKAREIDLDNDSHLKQLILDIESEQNKQRKRKAWELDQIDAGNQREYVEKKLSSLYPKTHHKFRVGDINVVGKVKGKVAKAYKSAPLREAETDAENVELSNIYSNYGFSRAFKEADDIFTLHKYVCMWLTYQNAEASKGIDEFSYVLHALKPYEYDLVRDQVTGVPVLFIQNYPDNQITRQAGNSDGIEQVISESKSDTAAQTRVYSIWSKDKNVTISVKRANSHGNETEEMTIRRQKTLPNVLGRLPITYLQADTAIDYPVEQNLGEQSVDWNVGLSDLKTAAATQGHGQLVISKPSGQGEENLHMGMHTAITLNQSTKPNIAPSTAEYISASPDLAGQLDVLKFDIMNILDDQGIKAKGAISGGVEEFSSGFDRLLSEADVQDRIEDNQSLYADSIEQGVFDLVRASELAMNQNTFPRTENLKITFEKPKVLISDKETLDNIEKRDELGTILSWEKHIILNPNLSEEQAKEREADIQLEKEEKLKKQQALIADTSSDDEDEDEDDNLPPVEGDEE